MLRRGGSFGNVFTGGEVPGGQVVLHGSEDGVGLLILIHSDVEVVGGLVRALDTM